MLVTYHHFYGSVAFCDVPGYGSLDTYSTLDYGSWSWSCYFRKWLSRCKKKNSVATFITVFKENKLLRIHKTEEIKVFLHFLLVDERIRSRIRIGVREETLNIIVYSSKKLTWGSELSTTPHLLLVHGHGVGEGSVDRGWPEGIGPAGRPGRLCW
jgi:hypothetical protein